jgi:hypothetical protein
LRSTYAFGSAVRLATLPGSFGLRQPNQKVAVDAVVREPVSAPGSTSLQGNFALLRPLNMPDRAEVGLFSGGYISFAVKIIRES